MTTSEERLRQAYERGAAAAARGEEAAPGCTTTSEGRAFLRGYVEAAGTRRPPPDGMAAPRYDRIGPGYASRRREDPALRERIHAALGAARTVVNVGAGTGSYEPRDRHVIAIEPSDVMA